MSRAADLPTAVVDTNLFVSGTIIQHGAPFDLLEAWRHQAFILLFATEQHGELRRVFDRPKARTRYRLSDEHMTNLFGDLVRLARLVTLQQPTAVGVRDPKDQMILATALEGDADYLVTGDDDLLVLAGDPRLGRLQIATARAFLARLPNDP